MVLGKVAEVTFWFWLMKIAATTLGETAGDAVTMSMNLGYLVGTAIFATIFIGAVWAQIASTTYRPFLYWFVIVATTTAGTTLADLLDRSLGIGYLGGTSTLLFLLLTTLFLWHRSLGTVSVSAITSRKAEVFYWATIMFSQTLGTALATGRQTQRPAWDSAMREVPWSSQQHLSSSARCTNGHRFRERRFSGRLSF